MRAKILIPILLILSLISCAEGKDDVLDVAVAQEPPTLDVMVNSSISGKMIAVGNVYEKLLTLSSDGSIIPELASSYELSENGHRLSFMLREGISFHDGTFLDTEDAVLSMNRWLDKYQAAGRIAGNGRFHAEGNVIVMESDNSLALLPLMIASSPQSAVIIPSDYVSDDPVLKDVPPGTGPYEVVSWRYGESIELAAYDDYVPYEYDKTPEIRRIIYRFVPDSVTRRLGLETGLYDAIDMVLPDDVPSMSGNEDITIIQGGDSGSIAVLFNKKEGISADADFRRAVSLIADRDVLMKACYGDYGYDTETCYMEPDQAEWHVMASDPYGYEDDREGMRLLEESSYDGRTVRILTSNLSNLDKIALALSAELEDAGMNTDVTVLDWASFIEERKDPGKWDISVSAFTKVTLPQMKSYLSPSFPGWTETDLLDQLYQAGSEEEAASLWNDIQRKLWEDVPAMILGHYSTIYAASSGIEGIIAGDGIYFWDASF